MFIYCERAGVCRNQQQMCASVASHWFACINPSLLVWRLAKNSIIITR